MSVSVIPARGAVNRLNSQLAIMRVSASGNRVTKPVKKYFFMIVQISVKKVVIQG
jgi:hypothetical protein